MTQRTGTADLPLHGGRVPRWLAERMTRLGGEVGHGAPYRFSDPARFSMALGGKDGHPFPVPLDVYDETIRVLKAAVTSAKLGNDDKLGAIRRLDEYARLAERTAESPSFDAFVAAERGRSRAYGGKAVGRARPAPAAPGDGSRDRGRTHERSRQLRLL